MQCHSLRIRELTVSYSLPEKEFGVESRDVPLEKGSINIVIFLRPCETFPWPRDKGYPNPIQVPPTRIKLPLFMGVGE